MKHVHQRYLDRRVVRFDGHDVGHHVPPAAHDRVERQGIQGMIVAPARVPDGYKDIPVDRMAARQRLEASLDRMLADRFDRNHLLDAVESKLFGIGVEACTVGSHEFYLGYAIRRQLLLCLDMGHFHPTETVADKLSSVSLSVDRLLLHVSSPMRWDSDLPFAAIWEEFCARQSVPTGLTLISELERYQASVAGRG